MRDFDNFDAEVKGLAMHGLMNIIYDNSNAEAIKQGEEIMKEFGFEPRDEEEFKKIRSIVDKLLKP